MRKRPPLLIHGEGGVGKSTLLARFILEHAEAHEVERFPFVYIDFDSPTVVAREPITLLVDAARQLSMQFPELADEWEAFRRQWTQPGDRKKAIQQFGDIYARLDVEDQPLLLVLDTFEEVQYRSRDDVTQLYEFLVQLQQRIPRLRTVLAGRAPVLGFATENLLLGDLDAEAAESYLRAHGVGDAALIAEVIKGVGTHPLSLTLATQFLQTAGADKQLDEAAALKEEFSDRGFFVLQRRLSREQIQGRLTRRILDHVHDADVRKIVRLAIVLRRITPELITEVIAEPGGLKSLSADEGQRLFAELGREVSLVTSNETDMLRFRPDIRKAMLPMLRADDPDTVLKVHRRAASYYAARTDAAARVEELYHRLAAGESPRAIDHRWTDDAGTKLVESVDELPPKAQAYVAARAGIDRDDTIWEGADLEDWERHVARRMTELIATGRPAQALQVAAARADRTNNSPLVSLEQQARSALSRDSDMA